MTTSIGRISRALAIGVILLSASSVTAQSPEPGGNVFNAPGFVQGRTYVSELPFEHVDTMTGSLVLSFDDLTLPGDAGNALRFQHTYNSKSQTWAFGIAGLPFEIWDQDQPPSSGPPDDTIWNPIIYMPDGSQKGTVWFNVNPTGDPDAFRWVMTSDFWRYDRFARKLYLPDGTVCDYDPTAPSGWPRRLLSVRNSFGTFLTLNWQPTSIEITQFLTHGDSRTITLSYGGSPDSGWGRLVPESMVYDRRTWVFDHEPVSGLLNSVQPPIGPPTTFGYSFTDTVPRYRPVTSVVLPGGGEVHYTYDDLAVPHGAPEEFTTHTLVLKSRSTGGRRITPGTWTYTYSDNTNPPFPSTIIDTPLGKRITFTHERIVWTSDYPLEERWLLTQRVLAENRNGQYVTVESETSEYRNDVSPDDLLPAGVLSRRTIQRDGKAYQSTYLYDPANFANYHRPSIVTETGDLTRITTLEYQYGFAPYITGRPRSRTVQVGSSQTGFTDSWTYDLSTGFMTSETRYGIRLDYAPDEAGNRLTTTDANQHVTREDHLFGAIGPVQTPEYTIDRTINGDGLVNTETRHGDVTTFQYDSLGRPRAVIPPEGNPAVTEYDDVANTFVQTGRCTYAGTSDIRSHCPAAVITNLDGFGRTTSTYAIGTGVWTRTDYDAEGRAVFVSAPFYDADNDPYNNPLPVGDTITYDAVGRPIRVTHSDSTFIQYDYSNGDVRITDEKGHTTLQHWVAFGDPDDRRLASVTDANNQVWTYAYTDLGRLRSVIAPDGTTRTWVYDSRNLLINETQPESGTKVYEYDDAGLLKKVTDARGNVHTLTYDGNNRVRSVVVGSKSTQTTYKSGSDKRQSVTVTNGSETIAATYDYDTAERLRSITNVLHGETLVTEYTPDERDNLQKIRYPSDRTVEYEYDWGGRISKVRGTSANGTDQTDYATNFQYHPSGAVASFVAGNGITHEMTFDPLRYWPSSVHAGSLSLQYQNYDAVGNVGRITDARPGFTQTFAYDELDRLRSAIGAYGASEFNYDAHGNWTTAAGVVYTYEPEGTLRLKTQGNNRQFTYDPNGNLITDSGTTFGYDPENMLTSMSRLGHSAEYAYDGDGMRAVRTVTSSNGTSTYLYVHGPDGRLMTELTETGGQLKISRDYIYAGSRLLAAVTPPPDTAPSTISVTLHTDQIDYRGAPATITLTADANDTTSTITQVDYYNGSSDATLIGSATTAPYEFHWQNVPEGHYVLHAVARNAIGQSRRSADVSVTVKAVGLLTSVAIDANENDIPQFQEVAMTIDGTNPCGALLTDYGDGTAYVHAIERLPVTFSYAWQTQGPKTLTFTAEGNCDGSITRAINVGPPNALPTVQLTAPANGSSFPANTAITLEATAADADGTVDHVQFYVNDIPVGSPDTTSPYSVTWTPTAPGNYQLTARATDNRRGVTTSNAATISIGNLSSITVNPSTVVTGQTVTVTVTGVNPCGAVDIDYGDGFHQTSAITGLPATVPLEQPYHYWTTAGTKTVTATGFGNCAGTISTTVQVNGNALPTVTLTSPAHGTHYLAPGTITLSANASDSDGTIARVEFYAGSTLVGTATSSPYTTTWSNAPAGSYILTAKAIDNANGETVSAGVSVSVDHLSGVTVTPATVLQGQTATVRVNGSSLCGAITIDFGDGTVITYAAGGLPYETTHFWTTTGTKTILAKGESDCLGQSTGTVTVNANMPPSATLTAPAGGEVFVAPANITLSATASDSDGGMARVEFYAGPTLVGTATASPYTVMWSNGGPGTYAITAKAIDAYGASTTSAARSITLTHVSSVTASPSTVIQGRSSTITVNGSINCTAVTVDYSDGPPITYAIDRLPMTATHPWTTTGVKTITATGQANCIGQASTTVTVTPNALPGISLTSPANNASYYAPASIPLSATASDSDGTIARVEFYANGSLIGTSYGSPYTATWSGVGVGTYTISARAYDDVGGQTDSAGATITVVNPGQVTGITLTSPRTLGQSSSVTVSGGNPCTAVEINWGDGTVQTYAIGGLPMSVSHIWAASGNLVVTAKGQSNCSGQVSTSINVNIPPAVTITSPANGSTFGAPASFDVTANASDADGSISRVDFYANGSYLGSDSTAPYGVSWSNVPSGPYTLQAVAFDHLSVSTTSAAVSIGVNSTGPSLVTSLALSSQPHIGTYTTLTIYGTNPCGAVQIDYGDGTVIVYPITALPYSQTHIWNAIGNTTITVTGMGNCSGQVSKTLAVVP